MVDTKNGGSVKMHSWDAYFWSIDRILQERIRLEEGTWTLLKPIIDATKLTMIHPKVCYPAHIGKINVANWDKRRQKCPEFGTSNNKVLKENKLCVTATRTLTDRQTPFIRIQCISLNPLNSLLLVTCCIRFSRQWPHAWYLFINISSDDLFYNYN